MAHRAPPPGKPRVDALSGPAGWAAVLVLLVATLGATGLALSEPRVAHVTGATAEIRAAAFGTRVDLDAATPAQLETLPGIGPALAQRIIEHRAAHGPFESLERLDEVKGIGPRTLERLRPHVASNASDPSQTRDRAPPARTPAPVDINAADAATLQTLPGIGPALAGRIVESRAQDGPFRSVEALTRVRGIGPKTLETLRPRLRVVGARSTPPPDSTPPAKPTDATAPAPARSSPVLSQSQGSLVDLNQASAERLDTLPGIGPALAARIIADRKAQGPYPSVDALARVKGIGPKTVAALRDKVRVGGAKPGANQPVSRSPAAAPANSASPINVNAANAEQLQALPGVGPVLSARLIADRRSNGPFKAAADLERVKGIGAKTAARLAPRVWFGPPDGPAYRPTKQAHRSR